jgi:hypothetical protein
MICTMPWLMRCWLLKEFDYTWFTTRTAQLGSDRSLWSRLCIGVAVNSLGWTDLGSEMQIVVNRVECQFQAVGNAEFVEDVV